MSFVAICCETKCLTGAGQVVYQMDIVCSNIHLEIRGCCVVRLFGIPSSPQTRHTDLKPVKLLFMCVFTISSPSAENINNQQQ